MFDAPNLWHLFAFRQAVKDGASIRAAEALGLTQPAVSQALKNLSDHYGAALTERRQGRLAPTAEGEILLRRASVALDLLSTGVREAAGGNVVPSQLLRAMSARRLEILVSIVRHGSFAAAARDVGAAAPTVHRAAKDLETGLGAALFERTSHGVKPTRRAEALANKAGLAFAELRRAGEEISAARGKEAGRTTIGAMPLARAHLVPAAVAEFTKGHRGHRVSIVEGAYEDLLMGLRLGEIDFLVGALREAPPVNDVVERPLFDDPLAVVMRAGHPVAGQKKLTKKAVTSYPWLAPRPKSPLRGHFDRLFEAFGLAPPEDVIECNSLSAARVLLIESDRLMLLSAEQIRYEREAGMLTAVPHPGGRIMRTIGLTTRRDWRPTATQTALLERITAHAQQRRSATRA